MIALAAFFGVVIGLTLGGLGAGGSILAVPVLVHVAGLSVSAATATSLVAVGSTAAVSAWSHRRRVDTAVAAWIIVASVGGAAIGASVGRHISDDTLLVVFSALIFIAAHRMLTACPSCTELGRRRAEDRPVRAPRGRLVGVITTVLVGLGVGVLTGLFGVGGGFVIVPILTLVLGRDMPTAIATSLLVVAGTSMVTLGVRGPDVVDWPVAVALTVPMLLGGVLGSRVARRIDAQRSLQVFAAVLVAVGVGQVLSAI